MLKLELPNDIQTRLELLSLSTGISIHFFALEAILEYLDELEYDMSTNDIGNAIAKPLVTR